MNSNPQQVVGFVFDRTYPSVVLIRKNHPDYQKGKWNGVGGKVNEGETPVQAMARECKEECGLEIPAGQWKFLESVSRFNLYVFFCNVDGIDRAKTTTEEIVRIFTNTEIKSLDLVDLVQSFLSKAKRTQYQNI